MDWLDSFLRFYFKLEPIDYVLIGVVAILFVLSILFATRFAE